MTVSKPLYDVYRFIEKLAEKGQREKKQITDFRTKLLNTAVRT